MATSQRQSGARSTDVLLHESIPSCLGGLTGDHMRCDLLRSNHPTINFEMYCALELEARSCECAPRADAWTTLQHLHLKHWLRPDGVWHLCSFLTALRGPSRMEIDVRINLEIISRLDVHCLKLNQNRSIRWHGVPAMFAHRVQGPHGRSLTWATWMMPGPRVRGLPA